MPHTTEPDPKSFAAQLPPGTYCELVHTLCLTLPPPLTDSPEDLARRDHSAISRIAALHPANAAEADIAALYVAASEQWKQCLHFARQSDPTSYWAQKCRAQANSMMRQSQSALRLLLRMQAARQKIEADSEARDRAAWTEHCAITQMAEALSPPAPEPQPEPTAPAPSPCGRGLGEGAVPAKPHTNPDTAVSPQTAAMIRVLERLDDPDDDLLQAIIATARATPSPGGRGIPPGSGTNGTSANGVHTDLYKE